MINKNTVKNLLVLTATFIYTFIYFILIVPKLPNLAHILSAFFILIITIISIFIYDYKKIKITKITKKIIYEFVIGIFIYFTFIYLLGLFTGFLRNSYSLRFVSILKNIWAPLISVTALEVFRYIYITNNREYNYAKLLGILTIIFFDISLCFYTFDVTAENMFIFLTVVIIPVIFKNIVLTYFTDKVGYLPCLIYVITLGLYIYLVPSVPDLGNYLTSIINICFPTLLYIYGSRMITYYVKEKEYEKNPENKKPNKKLNTLRVFLLDIPLIIIITIFVGLISGIFSYHLIGVDTSAIGPKIEKGDAIIIYKGLKYDDYEKGDIIAYKSKNKIIIDRIALKEVNEDDVVSLYVKKTKTNNKYTYKYISKKDLIGIYNNFKVKKIAYPTIWFKDLVKGNINGK